MLISRQPFLTKVKDAISRLKADNPAPIESANTISFLEDTLNLLTTAAEQFNLDCFPDTSESCTDLIDKNEGLTQYDLEGLIYLAQSVSEAAKLIDNILVNDTFITPLMQDRS